MHFQLHSSTTVLLALILASPTLAYYQFEAGRHIHARNYESILRVYSSHGEAYPRNTAQEFADLLVRRGIPAAQPATVLSSHNKAPPTGGRGPQRQKITPKNAAPGGQHHVNRHPKAAGHPPHGGQHSRAKPLADHTNAADKSRHHAAQRKAGKDSQRAGRGMDPNRPYYYNPYNPNTYQPVIDPNNPAGQLPPPGAPRIPSYWPHDRILPNPNLKPAGDSGLQPNPQPAFDPLPVRPPTPPQPLPTADHPTGVPLPISSLPPPAGSVHVGNGYHYLAPPPPPPPKAPIVLSDGTVWNESGTGRQYASPLVDPANYSRHSITHGGVPVRLTTA